MIVSRAQLLQTLNPVLTKIFGEEYAKYQEAYNTVKYVKRCRYGKYSIYRWDYENGERQSTTLARGLDKDTADGMMKLLREPT